MRRAFDSLTGQLVLLIIAALVVAQAISLWLFVDERSMAVRAALGFEAAGRAANVARLIEEAPVDLHDAILRAATSGLVRFSLSDKAEVDHANHGNDGGVAARVRTLLGGGGGREIRVELHDVGTSRLRDHNGTSGTVGNRPQSQMDNPMMRRMPMMHRSLSSLEMRLSIALADGQWLNVATRFERPPLQWRWLSTLSFGLTAAVIMIAVSWFLLSRLTGPLRRLARATDSLGRGEDVAMLPETGPAELRDLTRAFNRMQDRLTRFVADRTRVLAALGHDLRSPLTALRVRAEMVDDDETRNSLIASIAEMQEMVEVTLAFARGMATSEPYETVDLGDYLTQLRTDMLDEFTLRAGADFTLRLRPTAMRRALRNVIENATRYGGGATVSYAHVDGQALITVSDNGPGIPADELEHVFEPFFRMEKSRSRETGGTGLGLSIARTIVRAHGGEITLTNRQTGGLEVTIALPTEAEPPEKERNSS